MRSPNPSPTPSSFNRIGCTFFERVPGIGEEHAAQPPEERRAELGVTHQQLRASEWRVEERVGRQRVLRIAAHALRSAGIEKEIENRQRRGAPERFQPAPAQVAGQDDGAERLVIRPANQRAQVVEIHSELQQYQPNQATGTYT